jgi:hypothetical protein
MICITMHYFLRALSRKYKEVMNTQNYNGCDKDPATL